MDIIVMPLLQLIKLVLSCYYWALIIYIILHLLMVFKALDTKHAFIAGLYSVTQRIIEPLVRPIRKIVPNVGGFDLSIIVLFLIVTYLISVFDMMVAKYMYGSYFQNLPRMLQ